jgi:hypothetical protein
VASGHDPQIGTIPTKSACSRLKCAELATSSIATIPSRTAAGHVSK